MNKRSKTIIIITAALIMVAVMILSSYFYLNRNTVYINISNPWDHKSGDIFIEEVGQYYLTDRDYVDVYLDWVGNGSVMFLSSTSELSEYNIAGLFNDGTLYFPGSNHTRGSIVTINDKKIMLEMCSSDGPIHWGLGFIDDGGSIYSYGNRNFYIITKDRGVSNIKAKLIFQ